MLAEWALISACKWANSVLLSSAKNWLKWESNPTFYLIVVSSTLGFKSTLIYFNCTTWSHSWKNHEKVKWILDLPRAQLSSSRTLWKLCQTPTSQYVLYSIFINLNVKLTSKAEDFWQTSQIYFLDHLIYINLTLILNGLLEVTPWKN